MRRDIAWMAATALVCCALTGEARESTRAVLDRVREYVARYERELVTLVADEHYLQTAPGATRALDSEFAWLTVRTLGETVGVREVLRVDGEQVAAEPRLRRLLESPPLDPGRDIQSILAESARHNIGALDRNINFPTFALAYLRSRDRDAGIRWRVERLGDRVELRFEEREPPTLVRSREGGRSPARGAFLVQPDTGRILRSSIAMPVAAHGSTVVYELDVDFEEDSRLGLWVPARMRERAGPKGAVDVAGDATYTNYRRYETRGRVVQ